MVQCNFTNKQGIQIIEVPWMKKKSLSNAKRLIKVTLSLLKCKKIHTVFYFMTETHALILSPIFWIRRVRQVLWYAHANRPLRLIITRPFMTAIASSTSGSIPLKGRKVRLIGQMVDEGLFPLNKYNFGYRFNLIHVGRFDPSKKIENLIEAFLELKTIFPEAKLTLIGSPTLKTGHQYERYIKERYIREMNSGSLRFLQAVRRDQLSSIYSEMGVFIHAFQGSLDKTLVEATLSGMPVVTLNQEYLNEFGSWGLKSQNLTDELMSLYELEESALKSEISRRRQVALSRHTLSQWQKKIVEVLNG
jgi:glycosyltransferase involved in cell wall biosynthesis